MMSRKPKPEDVAPRLLAWFERSRRDLPWRRTRDPYRIWLAEVMLQQTQVSRVIDYYTRFLAEFPTARDVAAAPLEEVLRLWEGLGYYSRARSFHAACRLIADEHDGRFPSSYEEAIGLPGVGEYTAGAVLSIAFGIRLPAIDANATRVLCRVLLEQGEGTHSRRRIRAFGEAALPADRPGDLNQALMELGSLICRPRLPLCEDCCLNDICRARRADRVDQFPIRRRLRIRTARFVLGIVHRRGRVLIAQRPTEGVWGGLWEFPNFELSHDADAADVLERGLLKAFGLMCQVEEEMGASSYGIMNRRIRLHVCRCVARGGRTRACDHTQARWVRHSELGSHPLPAPHRRVAERYLTGAG